MYFCWQQCNAVAVWNPIKFGVKTTWLLRCLWKRREVVLELQWFCKQQDLWFSWPPPLPAFNQVRTKVNPPPMKSATLPPHEKCHPPWKAPPPPHGKHYPPRCGVWRWWQPSTLAFGAKSLVCFVNHLPPWWPKIRALTVWNNNLESKSVQYFSLNILCLLHQIFFWCAWFCQMTLAPQ